IRAVVGDASDLGLRVRYSHEAVVLGTAGGPRHALDLLGADRFFIVNGDTLTDVDLSTLAAAHVASGALVTMALVRNPDPGRYGGVVADEDGSVTGFVPRGPANRWPHFVGTQMVEARAFAGLPADCPAETVGELYPRLLADQPGSVRAFHCDALFRDIGTPADYLATSLQIARLDGRPGLLQGDRCHVDRTARLTRTILWDDVSVGAGAELVDCIVGDYVRIPAGARFSATAMVRLEGRAPAPGDTIINGMLVARFAPKPAQDEDPADDLETR
ncbi:MAG: hypothetical protein IMZ67_09315, partial [Acidobacteria bacterium]|nr:hypothetical protein [Acidobacteriota bacterium]